MNPTIIGVSESTMLGPGNVPVKVLLVKWTVGTFGPFTETTNWEDLSQGKTMLTIQQKAGKLTQLPAPAQA